MKVIFSQDVRNVAKKGESKAVNDGFARNYLFPKKLAVLSSPKTEKILQENRKSIQQKAEYSQGILDKKKTKLNGHVLLFSLKANDSGTTFSGLTREHIMAKIATEFGFSPSSIEVILDKPIKHIGEYACKVIIDTDKIPVTLKVTKQDE